MNGGPVGGPGSVLAPPAFPFLAEAQASAAQLPGLVPRSAYRLTLALVDSPLLRGKAVVIDFEQGMTGRVLAELLAKAAETLNTYAAEVEAREAAAAQAANDSEHRADTTEPGKNGTARPLPAPGG